MSPQRYFKQVEKFFHTLSSRQYISLPATDARNYEAPIIHHFVVSFKDCDETKALINDFFWKKYKIKPNLEEATFKDYKLIYQGKYRFTE